MTKETIDGLRSLGYSGDTSSLVDIQKWFREEKGIEVNAFWCYHDKGWLGYCCPMNLPALETEPTEGIYQTYEEALEEAIKTCLE